MRDCEAIRKVLLDNEKWTVVGQSFGGFCATAYLSLQYVRSDPPPPPTAAFWPLMDVFLAPKA